MTFEKQVQSIREDFFQEIDSLKSSQDVENIKVKYLGKKGKVSSLMSLLKDTPKEQLPEFGKKVNDLKQELSAQLETVISNISSKELEAKFAKEKIDVTLPGSLVNFGSLHPITQMMNRIQDVLINMGFSIQYGPDVESDFYNFEGLNFAKDHPARDMQDTFYLTPDLLLRTHTSNVQVRVMEKSKPPIRVAAPGRCFRNENISSRSHVFFHQVEAFYVDKNVSFADLLATLDEFWERLFNKKIQTRYRPSYFPFVEPGVEGDIRCTVCSGQGCRLCKNTGFLEVVGAGMIHPEVLKAGGIDPEEYSGFALGLGIERLAMLHWGIKDIRMFWENDLRFLQQFPS